MPAAWNCDSTHPNAAGYQAMGECVDLNLFR
jgi:lysophospholipase L1-like esterase